MTNGDCTWVQNNLLDYVRADGSTMGLALVQAIDQTANMVWVDKPLNQAKSNVVNQNSNTAANPPQAASINSTLGFPSFTAAADEIYKVEFFLRNLAATGQYFAGTSQIFSATAQRVQNLLSEITPSTVLVQDESLPLVFNNWLQNLLNTYPNGCTSRGQNAINLYRGVMNQMSARLQLPIPACFPLITSGIYVPSTFNPQLLMPPVPQSPRCNVPGTPGQVKYRALADPGSLPAIGILQYGTNNGAVQIMGSGNTNSYAVGSGPSISGSHVQGNALSPLFGDCPGSYVFDNVAANTATYATANIAFTCRNGLGIQDVDITFVMAGQPLPACTLVRANGIAPWRALCSPTAVENRNCVAEFIFLGKRQLVPLTMAISALEFGPPI
ncbi:hypothetical protein C8R46DRAFT_275140 [Mycena filopes]|nr:hypothetical protein C8R46DRAFT_275140 [Mycena filopes]